METVAFCAIEDIKWKVWWRVKLTKVLKQGTGEKKGEGARRRESKVSSDVCDCSVPAARDQGLSPNHIKQTEGWRRSVLEARRLPGLFSGQPQVAKVSSIP